MLYIILVTFDVPNCTISWGTVAAAPPPFRPGNPALCESCPLVTPYYCRLGDLLCYTCMLYLSILFVWLCMCILCFLYVLCVVFLYSFLLQYFDTVGWVFWPVKNRLPYNLYCVGGDVRVRVNPIQWSWEQGSSMCRGREGGVVSSLTTSRLWREADDRAVSLSDRELWES